MSGPHTNGTRWCPECGLWSKPPCRATDYCALKDRFARTRAQLRVAVKALRYAKDHLGHGHEMAVRAVLTTAEVTIAAIRRGRGKGR